jgi:hypothetical protein
MWITETIRSILEIVTDPHAFATAYVNHVERVGKAHAEPLAVAAYRFETTGRI